MTHDHLDAAAASLGPVVVDATDLFSDWQLKLIRNRAGRPRPIMANVATALRSAPEWKGVLGYDQFARQVVMCRPPPWVASREEWQRTPWTDDEDLHATEWMQRKGIYVKDREVALAVQTVAGENAFHPV